jgi:hypothetical protein
MGTFLASAAEACELGLEKCGKYRVLWAMYDSGCGESAGPAELGTNFSPEPSRMSKAKATFSTASGESVGTQGRRLIPAWLEGVGEVNVGFEVTQIPKLLLSARQVAKQGLYGWLGPYEGGLYDANWNKKVHLYIYRDVYWVKLFLRTDVKIDEEQVTETGGPMETEFAGKLAGDKSAVTPSISAPQSAVTKADELQKSTAKEAAMPQKSASMFEYRGFPRRLL